MKIQYQYIFFFLFLSFFPFFTQANGFIVETLGAAPIVDARKKLIEEVLTSDQMEFGYRALSIVLDSSLYEPRGQMKGRMIRLSPHVSREGEFLKLLVHEVAHYIDIYYLTATRIRSDPSILFYDISWESPKTKKSGEGMKSFVSGYAATNQYEDFAESFTFYVFHNEEFASRALKNNSLRQKYLFFQNELFQSDFFVGTDFSLGKIPSYIWDTTKPTISVKKYLFFLQK